MTIKRVVLEDGRLWPSLRIEYEDGNMDRLELSPQNQAAVRRWFARHGIGDIADIDFDVDTDEMVDPDPRGWDD